MRTNQTKSTYIILALIVMLGSALRLYGLSDKSLWNDEIGSVVNWAQKDITYIMSHGFSSDARVAPLYFIILHFFLPFGKDEFILRLPSVIFGVLSILLIYKVGEQLFGPKEGLISAFLLSISTFHVQYSQEARMYSLAMLLSLSSLFLFYKAIKENDKKLWGGSVLLAILSVLSHYYTLFVPLIEMIFFAFTLVKNQTSFIMSVQKVGKRQVFLLVLGLITISILLLPILQKVLYLIQTGRAFRVSWGLKPASFFEDLFSYFSLGFPYLFSSSFLYMFLLFFLLGLFTSIKEHKEQTVLLLFWVFLPTLIVFIISFSLGQPIATAYYLIFILPGYLIAISRGVSITISAILKYYYKIIYGLPSIPLPKRKQMEIGLAMVTVALLIFAGASFSPLQKYYEKEKENWRDASKYLEANSHPGDIILVEPNNVLKCIFFYCTDLTNTTIISMNGSLTKIKDIPSKYVRVWFVYSSLSKLTVDQEGKIEEWVRNHFVEVKRFTGIGIYFYSEELILVPTKDMRFIGLDSPWDKREARLQHTNDSATFDVDVLKNGNYTIAIHAKSDSKIKKSAIELVIDGESKGIKIFTSDDWSYVQLGTFYLNKGSREIKIINKKGGEFGETTVIFDQVAIWPEQVSVSPLLQLTV